MTHNPAATLRSLTKPQWDAALEAARVLTSVNPNIAEDRAQFRSAKARLVDLLPVREDANSIIQQAVHWDAVNSLALMFAEAPRVQGLIQSEEGR